MPKALSGVLVSAHPSKSGSINSPAVPPPTLETLGLHPDICPLLSGYLGDSAPTLRLVSKAFNDVGFVKTKLPKVMNQKYWYDQFVVKFGSNFKIELLEWARDAKITLRDPSLERDFIFNGNFEWFYKKFYCFELIGGQHSIKTQEELGALLLNLNNPGIMGEVLKPEQWMLLAIQEQNLEAIDRFHNKMRFSMKSSDWNPCFYEALLTQNKAVIRRAAAWWKDLYFRKAFYGFAKGFVSTLAGLGLYMGLVSIGRALGGGFPLVELIILVSIPVGVGLVAGVIAMFSALRNFVSRSEWALFKATLEGSVPQMKKLNSANSNVDYQLAYAAARSGKPEAIQQLGTWCLKDEKEWNDLKRKRMVLESKVTLNPVAFKNTSQLFKGPKPLVIHNPMGGEGGPNFHMLG